MEVTGKECKRKVRDKPEKTFISIFTTRVREMEFGPSSMQKYMQARSEGVRLVRSNPPQPPAVHDWIHVTLVVLSVNCLTLLLKYNWICTKWAISSHFKWKSPKIFWVEALPRPPHPPPRRLAPRHLDRTPQECLATGLLIMACQRWQDIYYGWLDALYIASRLLHWISKRLWCQTTGQ